MPNHLSGLYGWRLDVRDARRRGFRWGVVAGLVIAIAVSLAAGAVA